MTSGWIAAGLALFLWWFSTGAILLVVRWADRAGKGAHGWSVVLALPVMALGVAGLWMTRDVLTPLGSYGAFLSALAVWGWIELAFLSGVITGPNRHACPPRVREWERFIRAWGTIAYHEIALVAALLALLVLAQTAANPFGWLTFAVLYAARISAKLNLFLGVPEINTEFLPRPLVHLPSHFRKAQVSLLFPVSVTLLALATGCWLERIYAAPDAAATVGFALIATLTALALLEHWLMAVALPDAKLWRWMLPAPPQPPLKKPDERHAHGL